MKLKSERLDEVVLKVSDAWLSSVCSGFLPLYGNL